VKENLKPYAYKQWEHVKCDRVLFVERASELSYVARLRTDRSEAEGKPSLNRAKVACGRPETR
jgi:hypothetical protein